MDKVVYGSLTISTEKQEGKTIVRLMGRSDSRRPSAILAPFFKDLLAMNCAELVVDFGKLEYINSPTIPPIIRFIKQLEAQKTKSEFIYDSNSEWQVISFGVLQKLVHAKEIASVVIRSSRE